MWPLIFSPVLVKQVDCPSGTVSKLQDLFEIAIGAGVHLDQIDDECSEGEEAQENISKNIDIKFNLEY